MGLTPTYRDNEGVGQELLDAVRRDAIEVVIRAEEGEAGSSRLPVDDETAAFSVRGHRIFGLVAPDIDPDVDPHAGVVYIGYTADRGVDRQNYRLDDQRWQGVNLVDLNSIVERPILLSDAANRPAETDVERMQALADIPEASLIDDFTTYLSTDDPVNMDAHDYRKSRLSDYIDSCRQQSGKNSFLTWLQHPELGGNDVVFTLWYGHPALESYSSTIKISNILADDAGEDAAVTFQPAMQSELEIRPGRVFSKVIIDYDGGWVPVERAQTATDFALGGRDTTMSAPWINTKAAAIRYGQRVLADLATEEHIITTAIELTGAELNLVMHGHRIQARFSHFTIEGVTAYADWTWFRVVSKTIRSLDAPDLYSVALELTPPTQAPAPADLYGILFQSHGPYAGGLIRWEHPGGPPYVGTRATTGLISEISDSDPRPYTGWLIEGTGTIDVTFHATTVGVYLGTVTTTWAIQKNGVTVASETVVETYGGLAGSGHSATVTIADLAVEPDDEITATVNATGGSVWFFTIPGGVGDVTERLEITGGSLA